MTGPKVKAKWEKQNNSNKCKDGGRGRMSVERCVRERKIVFVFMLPILKKISSEELLQLRQAILKVL